MMQDKTNLQIQNNSSYLMYLKSVYPQNALLNTKVNYLQYIATFMAQNVTQNFSDSFLENELNSISNNLEFNLNPIFESNSILHVMTKAYAIGGHTKLLETMIKNTSQYFKKQSVIISDHESKIPNSLESLAKQHGDFIVFNKISLIDKAKKLAEIASNYEFIMLHIHQDDILANLAFGNKKFQRPIMFLNHADHMFWCGVSISDIILDLSNEGSQFSLTVRGVASSKVIHIPIEEKHETLDKISARKQLNISQDKKIILSIASAYKYGTTQTQIFEFVSMAMNILNKTDNCEFILIGPNVQNNYWAEANQLSNGRIRPLGRIDRDLLKYYIAATDLYIESFPFASYTAFLDTALYNVKMLSLKTPTFTLDVVQNNNMLADSIPELENLAVDFLNTNENQNFHIDLSCHLKDIWNQNFLNIIHSNLPKNHNIYKINSKIANNQYLSHINIILGQKLPLNKVYSVLPFTIKIQLFIGIIKYKLLNKPKEIFKLLRKTLALS